jgi:cytochrome c-type biogenesis protein CcmE
MPPVTFVTLLIQPYQTGHTKKDTVTMHNSQRTQRGASAIGIIIILAIIGVGAYIGFQYIPLLIEAGTVDSILSNIEKANEEKPLTSTNQIRGMIDRQLNINQIEELADNFTVTKDEETYTVNVNYERQLNLIYEKKLIETDKTLTLN